MILIVCIDDDNGMMFNDRRQSRDRAVISDIIKISEGKTVYMDEYSYKLFSNEKNKGDIRVCRDFAEKAGKDDFCFMERESPGSYGGKTEKLILYKWNRRYPHDKTLDIDLSMPQWRLVSEEEITGFSHERITKKIYDHE